MDSLQPSGEALHPRPNATNVQTKPTTQAKAEKKIASAARPKSNTRPKSEENPTSSSQFKAKTQAKPTKEPAKATSKKRKDAPEQEIDSDNASKKRASTPLPRLESELADEPNYERTPGRDGLIKPEVVCPSPDIKPFKGPPGKKVRKTFWEKEEEYKQYAFETEAHVFHELYVCHKKGPNGSPTYDKSGFQLDWKKVSEQIAPKSYNKNSVMRGMDKALERRARETKRMAEIIFEPGAAPAESEYVYQDGYWKDRVSKDLNIPWHKVGVKEFEDWEKKGFRKAKKGDYANPTEKEKKRSLRLLSGASLRK